jgi:hypothetical protein
VASTEILLFLEMLKSSYFIFLKENFLVKENEKYFEIFESIPFFKMKSSKLINYLTHMC